MGDFGLEGREPAAAALPAIINSLAAGKERSMRVVVKDQTNFVPGRSSSGGCYLEVAEYEQISDGRWAVRYWSSSDFDYCPWMGQYQSCEGCFYRSDEDGECEAPQETITLRELLERLAEVANQNYERPRYNPEAVGGYEVVLAE